MTYRPEPLPCPWCRGPITVNGACYPGQKSTMCQQCHAMGPVRPTRDEAVSAWNTVACCGLYMAIAAAKDTL